MCFTYLKFKKALEVQGIDRNTLPYKSWWQPFSAWYGLIGTFVMAFVGGYTVFLPGSWDVTSFIFSYAMIGVFPVLFLGWKIIKRTKWMKPEEVNLTQDMDDIDDYEKNYIPPPPA